VVGLNASTISPHVSAARTNVDDVSALLERPVAIDSINPTLVPGGSGEAAIARFVAEWLERQGVAVEYQELAPRPRGGVLDRLRGARGQGPRRRRDCHRADARRPDRDDAARAATAVLGEAPEIIGVPYWTDAGLLAGA
jgi:hypothetical protein